MSSIKLVKIIKALLYLLIFTPLIVSPSTIFPFNFGRGLATQLLIEIIFGLYLVLAIFNKKYRPKIHLVLTIFTLYLIWAFITSLFGSDFLNSFWSNEERFTGFLYQFHIFAVFVVIFSLLKTKKEWHRFLSTNVFVSILMLVIALPLLLYDNYWGFDILDKRLVGTLGNSIFLASYFLLNLIFAFYLFFTSGKKGKILFGILGLLLVAGILQTQTRGVFLGLISGVFFGLLFYIFFSNSKKARIAGIATFLAMIIFCSLIFIFKNADIIKNNRALSRITDISLSTTANTRLMGWAVAFEGIKERPITGWGVENFNIPFNKYYNPAFLKFSYYETWFDKPHNKILGVLIESGIIGGLLYLSLFGALFWTIYKKLKKDEINLKIASIFAGGAVAYFVQNLFAFDTPTSYLLFAFLMALILARKKKEGKIEKKNIFIIWPIFILLVFLGLGYFVNISPFIAGSRLRGAVDVYDVNKKGNIDVYKKTITMFNPYKEEWRVDLLKRIIANLNTKKYKTEKDNIDYAIGEFKKIIKNHPDNAYYHMLLGVLYSELSAQDSGYVSLAKEQLDKALELSPNRQHIYFAYARLYRVLKDKEKMIKVFEKAIELEPEAKLSYWEGAKQLYYLDRDSEQAYEWLKSALLKGFMPREPEEVAFVLKKAYNFLYKNEQYGVIAGLYKQLQKIEPNKVEWYAQEATARYLNKEYEQAIDAIKKAIELDPTYKQEGEEFIRFIEANK